MKTLMKQLLVTVAMLALLLRTVVSAEATSFLVVATSFLSIRVVVTATFLELRRNNVVVALVIR